MKKIILLCATAFLFFYNAGATIHVINSNNFTFSPSTLTFSLGDTVKWVNAAGSHTTTSTTIPSGATTWNSNLSSSTPSFIYVPKVAGTYNYQCNFHVGMGMIGTFIVTSSCPAVTVNITAATATVFCKGGSVLLNSTKTGNVSSYQWYLNNAAISGQTTSSYTATEKGTYTLRVASACGSKDTSNGIVVKVNVLPKATVTPTGDVNLCRGSSQLLTANTGNNFNYQWERNNVNINNATQSTFSASAAGTYKVIITNSQTGCTKTSAATKITLTACFEDEKAVPVTKTSNEKLEIFPDPVLDNLTLKITSVQLSGSLNINVYNGSGKLVKTIATNKSQNYLEQNINMKQMLPGLYFIRVSDGKNTLTEKFIKQ